MKTIKNSDSIIIRAFSVPVHFLVEKLHEVVPHNRKAAHVVVGSGVMVVGVLIASASPGHGILHVVLDVLGYGIHGMGAAPIIRVVAEKFKVEV